MICDEMGRRRKNWLILSQNWHCHTECKDTVFRCDVHAAMVFFRAVTDAGDANSLPPWPRL
jgi:hypothetical protein